MKAAVIYQHGGPDSLKIVDDFPDPKPGPNDVIIGVAATALNYHDLFTRNGMPGVIIPMPAIMGIDVAGEIVAVGKEVTDWTLGDRVVADPLNRATRGGLLGETYHGGLAEYCRVDAGQLIRVPKDVTLIEAAALPVAYGTAHRMMITIGAIKPGEKILILGASGGVGTCCVLLAKMVGAEVTACASTEEKILRLKRLGADHVLNYSEHDYVKEVYARYGKPHRRTFDGGVDVVVNFTGGDTWVKSFKCLRRGGRLLTCGATAGFDPKTDIRYIWTFELNVQGSNGWMRDDLTALVELIRVGKLKPVIEPILSLDQVHEGFRALEQRQAFGKIVVKP